MEQRSVGMDALEAVDALYGQKAALRADGYDVAEEHSVVIRRAIGEAACRCAPAAIGRLDGTLGETTKYRLVDALWAPAWAVEIAGVLPIDLPVEFRVGVVRRCASDPPLRDAIRAAAVLGVQPLLELIGWGRSS